MSVKEARGYSRNAYKDLITTGQSVPSHGEPNVFDAAVSREDISYLILLEGILDTPKRLQDAANMPEPPQTFQADSETGEAVFCNINAKIKQSNEK